MLELHSEKLEEYLTTVYNTPVKVQEITPLGTQETRDIKGFSYGSPCLIQCTIENQTKLLVLETMKPNQFGHEYPSDRAATIIWQHQTYNKLPQHVHAVDLGAFQTDNQTLKTHGKSTEYFLLTEYVQGTLYHNDLDIIKQTGHTSQRDEERCIALSSYLAQIHATKKDDPQLYKRAIRNLIGHGECIFGLTDSYPPNLEYIDEKYFIQLEKKCIEWRWQLKHHTKRLSQIHGDFHPWNIMFQNGVNFTVLDRSREEYGEPADDVAAMTINYIFYSLQTYGAMNGPYGRLFILFWKNYLNETGDEEILKIIQPFYAWRSLVIASPLWYPKLTPNIRKKIFHFAQEMLETKNFEYERVETYIK